jgi:hypothetical protein
MHWTQEAKQLFKIPKPEHFTNYRHCCEYAEHDATLLAYDVHTIGVEQLGNRGVFYLAVSLARVFPKEESSHLRGTEVNTPHFCQSIRGAEVSQDRCTGHHGSFERE